MIIAFETTITLLIIYFNFSIFEVAVFYGWEKRSLVFLVAHGSIAIPPFHHSMDEKFLFISRKWIKTLFEVTFLKNPTNPFSIAMIILIFVANVISFEIKNVCVRSDYLSCFHVILSYVKCLMLILGTCLFSCVSSKVIVSHACIYHITYRIILE